MVFSIIILSCNAAKTIGKLLKKLTKNPTNYNTELIIVDSGSTDKTLEIAKNFKSKFAGFKILQIKKKDFNYGLTRNMAVEKAKGRYVCFFSQDAIPISKDILFYYLQDFQTSDKVVAVYGKHLPFENTPVIQKVELLCHWGRLDKYVNKRGVLIKNLSQPFTPFTDENKQIWYQLSNTAACYKKSFLLRNPFPQVSYGEDMHIGKNIIANGLSIVYDTRCSIYHSDRYSLLEYYKREKESMRSAFVGMNLKIKSKILCKIKHILRMNISFIKKFFYLFELGLYYVIKIFIILRIKIPPIRGTE